MEITDEKGRMKNGPVSNDSAVFSAEFRCENATKKALRKSVRDSMYLLKGK